MIKTCAHVWAMFTSLEQRTSLQNLDQESLNNWCTNISPNSMASTQANKAAFNFSLQQMQAVIALSHMSVQELHAQNIPEKMIQFVENHRTSFQHTHQDQNNYHWHRTLRGVNPSLSQGGSQISEQGRPSILGLPGIGPSNSFGGSPVALTIAARQFLQ
jgi:hypothetical protein